MHFERESEVYKNSKRKNKLQNKYKFWTSKTNYSFQEISTWRGLQNEPSYKLLKTTFKFLDSDGQIYCHKIIPIIPTLILWWVMNNTNTVSLISINKKKTSFYRVYKSIFILCISKSKVLYIAIMRVGSYKSSSPFNTTSCSLPQLSNISLTTPLPLKTIHTMQLSKNHRKTYLF